MHVNSPTSREKQQAIIGLMHLYSRIQESPERVEGSIEEHGWRDCLDRLEVRVYRLARIIMNE